MARKCKVCGDAMVYKVGDHYKDTGRGQILYTGVRQYSCPSGCRSTFYDYRRARPAGTPEKILWLIPAPRRVVNVEDPLLAIGLVLSTVLMIVAFLGTTLSIWAKVAAITLLTTFAVWLMNFMGSKESSNEQGSE